MLAPTARAHGLTRSARLRLLAVGGLLDPIGLGSHGIDGGVVSISSRAYSVFCGKRSTG
jgi:hypothetical protein